jgi:hypothetical protein
MAPEVGPPEVKSDFAMTDWIEQKTAQIEAQKGALDEPDEKVRQRRSLGLQFLDQLEVTVQRDIEKWNKLNPGYRRRIDGMAKSMPSGGFQVRKTSFPSATVDVILGADSLSIQVQSTFLTSDGNRPQTVMSQFGFKPDSDGKLFVIVHSGNAISFEAASQILLEPLTRS